MRATLVLLGVLVVSCGGVFIEVETFLENDRIMIKAVTMAGLTRSFRLTMDGRVSTCDISAADASFMDVAGLLFRPIMSTDPTSACVLDMKFMFSRYRRMILSHNSIVFSEEPLVGGKSCMRDSTTHGLCESRDGIVTMRWFSNTDLFYENLHTLVVEGIDIAPAPWSVRTPRAIVDVVESAVVRAYDIEYDIVSHRMALTRRKTSIGLKIVAASMGMLVSFLFVVRLHYDKSWQHLPAHIAILTVASVATLTALCTQANKMRTPAFLVGTLVTLPAHLALEAVRVTFKRARCTQTAMFWVDLKPDMAIIMVSVTLSFYAITTHSLILLPALMTLLYASKMLAEVVNLRLPPVDTVTPRATLYRWLVLLCVGVDVVYTLILWRYIIGDFVRMTLIATWYIQELLLAVVVVHIGLYVANIQRELLHTQVVRVPDA
jgi:hypothetical protein